jgi:hypothetical protein
VTDATDRRIEDRGAALRGTAVVREVADPAARVARLAGGVGIDDGTVGSVGATCTAANEATTCAGGCSGRRRSEVAVGLGDGRGQGARSTEGGSAEDCHRRLEDGFELLFPVIHNGLRL